MKLDKERFEKLVDKRLLSKDIKGDLTIYNYTPDVQFGKMWDKWTTMARGLILRNDGTIIARPFPKFFNLGERTTIKDLPSYQPEITEKMDGSMGILYPYEDGYAIATRGSFKSEQAMWATTWLKERGDKRDWKENITYIFEIIYPMNRIVVNYGERAELVLIGLVHNWTGKISSYKELRTEAERLGFTYPHFHAKSIVEIQKVAEESKENEEGYVLFYPDDNLQIKVKLNDYVRLHRLTFGISVKSIWENMGQGKTIEDIFKDAPDEVYDWVKNWKTYYREQEQKILNEALIHLSKVTTMETRKEQALYLQKEAPQYLAIVFSMIDSKPYLQQIYMKFKPSAMDAIKTVRAIHTGDL